jgi:subtilisin family serine protease
VIATITLPASSIIGLADTGITRQNCYFCSSSAGAACYNTAATVDSSRNVFMYWFIPPDQCALCGRCGTAAAGTSPAQGCGNDYDEDGHGTHVAATIVGTSDQATAPDSARNNGIVFHVTHADKIMNHVINQYNWQIIHCHTDLSIFDTIQTVNYDINDICNIFVKLQV